MEDDDEDFKTDGAVRSGSVSGSRDSVSLGGAGNDSVRTNTRPVDEVLFLKSFRRAITVIGIGATRIRWERRITKKRTYEKVV